MATEFIVEGTPRSIAEQIEQIARAQGSVTALVVPWESTATVLSVAVTAVKIDGWAIEHTNLGTIRLSTDPAGTRVAANSDPARAGDTLATMFDRLADDVRRRLQGATEAG